MPSIKLKYLEMFLKVFLVKHVVHDVDLSTE